VVNPDDFLDRPVGNSNGEGSRWGCLAVLLLAAFGWVLVPTLLGIFAGVFWRVTAWVGGI
jgi:hypothetical protein